MSKSETSHLDANSQTQAPNTDREVNTTPSQEARSKYIKAWNDLPDQDTQWMSLSTDAKIEFIRRHDAVRELFPVAAVIDVLSERSRQVDVKGYTGDYDDANNQVGDLALAACAYAMHAADRLENQSPGERKLSALAQQLWGLNASSWKPQNPRRALVKAGALILAEIERLDRAERLKGL